MRGFTFRRLPDAADEDQALMSSRLSRGAVQNEGERLSGAGGVLFCSVLQMASRLLLYMCFCCGGSSCVYLCTKGAETRIVSYRPRCTKTLAVFTPSVFRRLRRYREKIAANHK
jgi:hypothetical protein